MNEPQKIDLTQTNDALAELSAALQRLNEKLETKKKEIIQKTAGKADKIKQLEQKSAFLKQAAETTLLNMDSLINHLDKVLENNGTSHNNN